MVSSLKHKGGVMYPGNNSQVRGIREHGQEKKDKRGFFGGVDFREGARN